MIYLTNLELRELVYFRHWTNFVQVVQLDLKTCFIPFFLKDFKKEWSQKANLEIS